MDLSKRLTFHEEVANSVTHGVMSVLLILALPLIAIYTYMKGGLLVALSVSVFVISLLFMFLMSTLYHVMAYDSPHKRVFRILDHSAIFVAIAGTYTPVALAAIGGWKGLTIVLIQWAIVLFGILYKALSKKSMGWVSLALYIAMGWMAVFFLPTIIRSTNSTFLWLIVTGGVLYTVGAYFYTKREWKFHHMIWHLFINAASIAHLIAIVFFLV